MDTHDTRLICSAVKGDVVVLRRDVVAVKGDVVVVRLSPRWVTPSTRLVISSPRWVVSSPRCVISSPMYDIVTIQKVFHINHHVALVTVFEILSAIDRWNFNFFRNSKVLRNFPKIFMYA